MFTLAHLSDPHIGPIETPRCSRADQQARARADQLVSQAPSPSSSRRARRDRARHARAAAGSHRADRRSRQHLARFRIRPRREVARHARQAAGRDAHARQPRCLREARRRVTPRSTGASTCAGTTARAFPFVRRRGPVAIIALTTSLPTGPFMATGRLGGEQLARLAEILIALVARAAVPRGADPSPADPDAPALHEAADRRADVPRDHRRARCELMLHGHNHEQQLMWLDGPQGAHSGGRRAVGLGDHLNA